MSSPRDAILDVTVRLLDEQGYAATGLNQIVSESGAPKGSLYHYFPDGKEGLTAEAIARVARLIEGRIRAHLALAEEPGQAVDQFLRTIARALEATECRGGGPLTAVTLETAGRSERLRAACQAAYEAWQAAFAEKLRAGGYSEARAAGLARLIVALIEGAVVLCRAERSPAPLEQVADELRLLLANGPRG